MDLINEEAASLLDRGFRPAVGQNNQITQGMNAQKGKEISSPCQICGRNNHTALKCFYRWDFSYQASDDLPQALAVVNLQDTKNEDNTMYVDSGASTHMINSPGNLSNLQPYKGSDKIVVGNGSELNITLVGSAEVSGLKMQEVLVVPELKSNLLSVSKLAKDNFCTIEFSESFFVVKYKATRKILAIGSKRGGPYALDNNNLKSLTATQRSTSSIWHARLGHLNLKLLHFLSNNKRINITCWNKTPTICVSCQMGKSCKLPFEQRNKIENEPLLKIH